MRQLSFQCYLNTFKKNFKETMKLHLNYLTNETICNFCKISHDAISIRFFMGNTQKNEEILTCHRVRNRVLSDP